LRKNCNNPTGCKRVDFPNLFLFGAKFMLELIRISAHSSDRLLLFDHYAVGGIMKICIIGATRGIGRALLTEALQENHEVTVLARNPAKIAEPLAGLNVIKGDASVPEDVQRCVLGQDAVCSCIGVPITFRPVDLFSRTARNILAALDANAAQKYVAVTGIGAGESKGHGGFLYDRIFQPLLLKSIYEDKDREERLIKASSANWLIVRPAGLTNGPRTGNYRVIDQLDGVTARRISRSDVADYILAQLATSTDFGKAVLLTY
jgi:putative NADH-flavin reductase